MGRLAAAGKSLYDFNRMTGSHSTIAADSYNLGAAARASGDKAAAMAQFQAAMAADPHFVPAWADSAEIYLEDGFFLHALDLYARGIHANPDSADLKEKFVFLLRSTGFRVFNPQLKRVVIACLETDGIDFFGTGPAWHSILKSDPGFQPVYKAFRQKDYKKFRAVMDALPDPAAALDPFFLMGLEKIIVADLEFERALGHLRRYLLDMLCNDRARFERSGYARLAEALAQYCFFTGYIFDTVPEETAALAALRPGDAGSVAVIACYRPLSGLDTASDIAARFGKVLPGLIRVQITDVREERAIRESIIPLTPIDDRVSRDVRQQYEDFPYPRWITYSKRIYDQAIEGPLHDGAARILVAGTGTGREAIELGHLFPDASVLAVDLSLSSLAYGIAKARHYGVGNVAFRQADILALAALPDRFDFIASSGVLHHMQDPYRGWAVLAGLLKPGGLMRVALYSGLARQSIAEARAVIARKGYASDAAGIRRFRHDCKKLLTRRAYRQITGSTDFYSMQECRDLLFHVQEHGYTIPMIREQLDRLGLRFMGFQLTAATMRQFAKMFPGGSPLDLALWDRFERKKPETFMAMYKFWCQAD